MKYLNSEFMLKWRDLFLFILLLLFFIFSRLYRIQTSLLYFNDVGRDSLALLDWQTTGKPPLLGPQTSALPFNQSAVYFYILYPLFLLCGGSVFSANYTLVLFYGLVLALAFYIVRRTHDRDLLRAFFGTFLLIILHPQFIIQNRFVWNPSFVGPLILLSFIFFYLLSVKFTWKRLMGFAASLALAISLTYSVAPTLIAFFIIGAWLFKNKIFLIGLAFSGWLFIFNLPTVFFELRHHFLLTEMMLHREKVPEIGADLSSKLNDFFNNCFTAYPARWQSVLLISFVIAILIALFWMIRKKPFRILQVLKTGDRRQVIFSLAFAVLSLSTAVTFILPIPLHSHYVFGLLIVAFISISALPKALFLPLISVFFLVWGSSIATGQYFRTALRTVTQMQSCYQTFCAAEKNPLFVSVQSGFSPYHNGLEHRYLLKKAGCNIQDIETNAATVSKMAVVIDDSTFDFGKTSFNELTMFSPTQLGKFYSCQPNLQIQVLTR